MPVNFVRAARVIRLPAAFAARVHRGRLIVIIDGHGLPARARLERRAGSSIYKRRADDCALILCVRGRNYCAALMSDSASTNACGWLGLGGRAAIGKLAWRYALRGCAEVFVEEDVGNVRLKCDWSGEKVYSSARFRVAEMWMKVWMVRKH